MTACAPRRRRGFSLLELLLAMAMAAMPGPISSIELSQLGSPSSSYSAGKLARATAAANAATG